MTPRPGIAGEVLARSHSGKHTPYSWLARAVAGSARLVLDIACGVGAMSAELHRPDRVVIGLDRSMAELAAAAERGVGPWVQADAVTLPFADDTFDAVTSSMGVAVIEPTDELLAEVSRVLKPGGVFAALLPSMRPASPADLLLASQLSWLFKKVLRFPGSLAMNFTVHASNLGLTTLEDARERYEYPIRSRADAERLFAALDLEGVSEARIESVFQFLEERVLFAGVVELAIPMRRVVVMK